MKNSPYARFFWSKSNFLKLYTPDTKYSCRQVPYSLGIYRRIYPAAGVRNIPAAPDISGSWQLRGQ